MASDSTAKPHTLIIGVGNEYRGDDAVGVVVARHLQQRAPAHVTIITQSGEGAALMEVWKNAENVIIIDAVHSGAAPGAIFRFDAAEQAIPVKFFHYSTHAFSVAEAIELARALQQLPPRLVVYGIEGKAFEAGAVLSPEVEEAVLEAIAQIQQEAGFNAEAKNFGIQSGELQPPSC
jgi:hydrogenase maturation protease